MAKENKDKATRKVLTEKENIKAVFTNFGTESNWVQGTVEGDGRKFTFEAKLFDNGSEFGIKEGRVSKLAVSDPVVREQTKNYGESCVVEYDRGWGMRPKKEIKPYFNAIMELLENSPKRFDK